MKAMFIKSLFSIAAFLAGITAAYPAAIYAQGNDCILSENEMAPDSANLYSGVCDPNTSEEVAATAEGKLIDGVLRRYRVPTDRYTDDRSAGYFNPGEAARSLDHSSVYLPAVVK